MAYKDSNAERTTITRSIKAIAQPAASWPPCLKVFAQVAHARIEDDVIIIF